MTCPSDPPPARAPLRPGYVRAGFTLIELIVVMAIIGLVLALASPRLHRALPRAELAAKSEELAAALRGTRARAIAQGEVKSLVIDIDDGRFGPPGALGRTLPQGTEIEVDTALDAIDTVERRAALLFYGDGTAAGGRIVLSRGEEAYRLDVDWLTGRIAVEAYQKEK